MKTIFRKVSVKDRLPDKECKLMLFNEHTYNMSVGVFMQGKFQNHNLDNVTDWLEEVDAKIFLQPDVSINEGNPILENKKYAEVAVDFADWIIKRDWKQGYEYWCKNDRKETTQGLFEIFQNEKAKSTGC